MLGKILFAVLLVVLAYKAFGWFRTWQARQQLPDPPERGPIGPGEDLRRCTACDRYVDRAAILVCKRSDCPMKAT